MKFRTLCAALICLGLVACAADPYGRRGTRSGYSYDAPCSSCGTVQRIEAARQVRASAARAPVGALGGGLIGAALGAGPVATASPSHGTERPARSGFAIYVRMDDGRQLAVEQRALQGVREGARVVVRDGRATLM